jgi:hypothetical protein
MIANAYVGKSAQMTTRPKGDVRTAKLSSQHPPTENYPRAPPYFTSKRERTISTDES